MLDTHVLDALLADDALLARLRSLTAAGTVEPLLTHIQVDQVSETPTERRRSEIASISFLPSFRLLGCRPTG